MKKVIVLLPLVLVFALQSCMISRQPKMEYFKENRDAYPTADFVTIKVPMLVARTIARQALRDEGFSYAEAKNMTSKITGVRVMAVNNASMQMNRDFNNYLSAHQFEEWMTIKKDSETITIQAKQENEKVRKMFLTVRSEDKTVYIDVSGKFTADDISEMINLSERNAVKFKIN